MSLCITVNNPISKYIVMAADGRTTRDGDVVSDSFRKLTLINSHVSIFTSGVLDCSEELRAAVSSKGRDKSIDEIGRIAQEESQRIHEAFELEHPDYFEGGNQTDMATIIGFFDVEKSESGYIKLCKSDNYTPHKVVTSSVQTSGYSQDVALNYFLKNFDSVDPLSTIVVAVKHAASIDKSVGGLMTMHVISENGTDVYQVVI